MSPPSPSPEPASAPGSRPLWWRHLLWLILPLVFYATVSGFRASRGPWLLSPTYDPDYAYLLNGLNFALRLPPKHVDHPGTPLQLGLGAYIRARNLGVEHNQTAVNVLEGMESYLTSANRLFLIVYALALAFAGWSVARSTGQLAAGLLVQATPFLMGGTFQYFARVSPEPFLMLLSLVLVVLLVRRATRELEASSAASITPPGLGRGLALALAASVGTAIAVKVNALPLALLLVVLGKTWRERALCLGVIGATFVLWTLPILERYAFVFGWFWELATKLGVYGRGDTGLVRPAEFLGGLGKLLGENPGFTLTLLVSIAGLWRGRPALAPASEGDRTAIWWRLLLGLVTAQVAQLLISAKNPQSRYLAPAHSLLALNWLVLWQLAACQPAALVASARRIVQAALIALLVFSPLSLVWLQVQASRTAADKFKLAAFVNAREPGSAVIFHYGASSLIFALSWASSFAGNAYHGLLDKMIQPEAQGMYFLNHWSGETFTLKEKIEIRAILEGKDRVFIQGDALLPEEMKFLPAGYVAEPAARAGDEVLYLVRKTKP